MFKLSNPGSVIIRIPINPITTANHLYIPTFSLKKKIDKNVVNIGAANEIRSKLLQLAKVGKAIILISQDLDEIYEISNNICVINNGSLSIPKNTSKISATDIGILMGIN